LWYSRALASPHEGIGKRLLLLFVVLALIWHRLVKALGGYFCCYLWYSRSLASPREAICKPLLLLFVVLALIGLASGEPLFQLFVVLALIGLASRSHVFCYLWYSRSLASPCEGVGKPLLLLFVVLTLLMSIWRAAPLEFESQVCA
jgi:hypothetical protein